MDHYYIRAPDWFNQVVSTSHQPWRSWCIFTVSTNLYNTTHSWNWYKEASGRLYTAKHESCKVPALLHSPYKVLLECADLHPDSRGEPPELTRIWTSPPVSGEHNVVLLPQNSRAMLSRAILNVFRFISLWLLLAWKPALHCHDHGTLAVWTNYSPYGVNRGQSESIALYKIV